MEVGHYVPFNLAMPKSQPTLKTTFCINSRLELVSIICHFIYNNSLLPLRYNYTHYSRYRKCYHKRKLKTNEN